MRRSAYEVLHIAKTASAIEIRTAYRRLAKSAHPDQAGGDPSAHENFLEIKAAYEILIDPIAREAYDRDPSTLEQKLELELRKAQLLRRKRRLRRLYES